MKRVSLLIVLIAAVVAAAVLVRSGIGERSGSAATTRADTTASPSPQAATAAARAPQTAAGAGAAALEYLKARERWVLAGPALDRVGWNEAGPPVGGWFVPGSTDAMREWFVLLGKWETAGRAGVRYASVDDLQASLRYVGLREGGAEALVIAHVSADIGATPLRGSDDAWGESDDTLHRLALIWMGATWRVDSDRYVDGATVRYLRAAGAPAAMIEAARRQLALAGYGAKGPAQAVATVRRFFILTARHRYAAAQRLVAKGGTWRSQALGKNIAGIRYLSAEFEKGTRDKVLLYVHFWADAVKVRAGSLSKGENALFVYLVRDAKTGGWRLFDGGSGP